MFVKAVGLDEITSVKNLRIEKDPAHKVKKELPVRESKVR